MEADLRVGCTLDSIGEEFFDVNSVKDTLPWSVREFVSDIKELLSHRTQYSFRDVTQAQMFKEVVMSALLVLQRRDTELTGKQSKTFRSLLIIIIHVMTVARISLPAP